MKFSEVFARLEKGPLSADDIRASFEEILAGEWTAVQIGAFAAAMRLQGEGAEAIGAAAEALRAVMSAVDHGLDVVADTCGTGGDGAHTINVSTAAAIVLASCSVHVAKHGNRSVSSRCGSADVVAALGIPLDLDTKRHAKILRDAHITFLMAPAHHPALRHAAEARRELGVRTIFNALGPLINPARATHQLIGVYEDRLRPIMAGALDRLGTKRAWIVRSMDGLDEISPAAPTHVSVLEDGQLSERVVSPEDFGVERVSLDALAGGDADTNAKIVLGLLHGEPHDAANAVILNAAAALHVVRGDDLRACAKEVRDALESGRALATLEKWREVVR
jgi:anthranilate phosphoribosyltransferase